MIALLTLAFVLADGPDLAAIDQAVGKCDTRLMTRTFADEPQRRRSFAIAAYNEQQEIVAARRALAGRRFMPPVPPVMGAPGSMPPVVDLAALDREARLLAERQQELDDARMLSAQRDGALDMMRRDYLARCAVGKANGQD